MTTVIAKLRQKKELSKDYIDSVLKKSINYFFESVKVNVECDLNYIVNKVEGNKVHVFFSWISGLKDYEEDVNYWNLIHSNFSSEYNFSKDKEDLLDEIISELEENVIVNF